MKTVLILVMIFLAPTVFAILCALVSEFGPAGRKRREVIDRMGIETDASWAAYLERQEAAKGAPCDECGLDYGYHRPWCREWPTRPGGFPGVPAEDLAKLHPWTPA